MTDLIPLQNPEINWDDIARDDQKPPQGDWHIWLLLGGRGAGKTRAGAEWIRKQVKAGARRIALIGPSYNEVREVMILGESGLLNIGQENERPVYFSSRKRLEWENGAVGQIYSAEDPDGLRGPQFECAWADEFCAWSYPENTLANLRFCLRLGEKPRIVMTTTPKPIPALKKLIDEKGVILSRASTMDNRKNLSPAFMSAILDTYAGTSLGRQELNGEIIEDVGGRLWSRAILDTALVNEYPKLDKIIVAIDPPITSGPKADACGIIVAGCVGHGPKKRVYILQDGTAQGLKPTQWAKRSHDLLEEWGAEYILAEGNQGGEMIKSIFLAIDQNVRVETVFASKSKVARASPVFSLYEKEKVKHVGGFPDLEDELCLMGAEIPGKKSPDRADALVWAVTQLALQKHAEPRIRRS
ncbi:MAG: terminase family protein [Robiginitomaculum sp.]